MAGQGVSIAEYIENMRALLDEQPELYGIMVARQVCSRVLPRVAGRRVHIEPGLWQLLIFCLDGHRAPVPDLNDAAYERATSAAGAGTASAGAGTAAYPDAARAVAEKLAVLRDAGVLPPPRM